MNKIFTLFFSLLLIGSSVFAQDRSAAESSARGFLNNQLAKDGYITTDYNELIVTDIYQTKKSGITHVYFIQAHNGVPIKNAIFNVNVRPDNTIQHFGNRFYKNKVSLIEGGSVKLSSQNAINVVADDLGYDNIDVPAPVRADDNNGRTYYEIPTLSQTAVYSQPKYFMTDGTLKLTYEVFVIEKDSPDSWYIYVDAQSGDIINKKQNTIFCAAHPGMYAHHDHDCDHDHDNTTHVQKATEEEISVMDGASYFALPFPVESPIHGNFELIENPSIEAASPYGWHDLNGVEGPEFTITRGNNVWAYQDRNNTNSSAGDEPDGGDDLIFNFPYDGSLLPDDNVNADVVGLFYACNMIHDLTWLIGYDTEAGAFQNNNYGGIGFGNDLIFAEALDGSGTNNANFAPAPDGLNGRMQMFRWDVSSGLFRVLSPTDVAGEYEDGLALASGGWGVPEAIDIDVTAEIVVVADSDPATPQNGCGELVNDVNGKIAFIFRGLCQFGTKALNAQNAGAVAAVICNVPGVNGGDGETPLGMAPGDDGALVTIPTTSLGFSDCNRIIAAMSSGPVTVQLRLLDTTGPDEVSSGFDNGIIAHEYAHGISNRLVGGPSSGDCLNNDEQTGEGISDYLALITTVEPDDTGADPRGIGNFVLASQPDGRGIRRFPYSTDMSINPQTFDDIKGTTAPHPLGEVWADVLWDIYWRWVDLYGWDADFANAEAGNVRAMQLAFDGMKAAPCDPGFVDLRDAILAVDDGEHECILWEIFARRGLGYFADGGSANDRNDGTEDFEVMPTCIATLKVNKTVVDFINPGDELDVRLDIANHTTDAIPNVIVTDLLSDGLSYVPGSGSIEPTVNGNLLMFEIGNMETLDTDVITYTLQSDPSISSTTLMINQVESNDDIDQWQIDFFDNLANLWGVSTFDAVSGNNSFYVAEIDGESDQKLSIQDIPVFGDRPVIRFFQRSNSLSGENGGFVELSEDSQVWLAATDEQLFRGGYDGPLTFTNFAIPFLNAYSGETTPGGFEAGYLDVSEFSGGNVSVRFRFGTYDLDPEVDLEFEIGRGWYIDDLELMDMRVHTTEACISGDNADEVCTDAGEIIINSSGITSTNEVEIEGLEISMFPNPANDYVTINIKSERSLEGNLSILTIDGKLADQQKLNIVDSNNFVQLNTAQFDAGFYLVQFNSGEKVVTKKLIIQK